MRRSLVSMVALALFAAACGDDGGGSGGGAAPQPDPEVCAALSTEEPTPEGIAALPDEYRDAADALTALGDVDLEDGSTAELADRLLAPGVGEQLAGLADLAAACGAAETERALRSFALMTELGSVEADEDYCNLLVDEVADSAGAEEPSDALLDAAPAEHRAVLERLAAMGEAEEIAAEDLLGLFGGLGLYAESRCGSEEAFGALLFIGLFASAFADEDGIITSSGIDPTTEPSPADPSAANAALAADAGFSFVTRQFAVESDGEYIVSAVVPEGWETDDEDEPFFGVTFTPGEGAAGGFFSDMTFRAGCDGLCEPTDWEERLTADGGYLTMMRDGAELLVDEARTDGWLLVTEGFSGGLDGTVLRWNDGADRYLICEFTLDEDDVDHVDAFIAACESSNPGWFPA